MGRDVFGDGTAASGLIMPALIDRFRLHCNSVAVESNRHFMSYSDLSARAGSVASLLSGRNVGPDEIVGVCLPRGGQLIAALLGVLGAGAAFLLLDPDDRPERLAGLLHAAGTRFVLASARHADLADLPGKILPVPTGPGAKDGWPSGIRQPDPEHLAYLVFTSGSTGVPKPVAITHRALMNHGRAVREAYELGPVDRVLQFSHQSFDVFVEEVFPTLLAGGTVVTLPDRMISPTELEQVLNARRVTVVNLPTPYWAQWARDRELDPQPLPESLRLVVIGSASAESAALARWQRQAEPTVVNAYGLSETTITVACASFPPATAGSGTLPIGHVLPGAVWYVLDSEMRQLRHGKVGELYVGGDALARGYRGMPALTAERFVPDPFSAQPGARLLRTGDLARVTGDGVELCGRIDDQVKIRGHRVEPREPELVLAAHPAIAQAHVCPYPVDGGEQELIGYVVPRDSRSVPSGAALAEYLKARLPQYLIPSRFAVLNALPLTASGKVDRPALPPISRARPGNTPRVPPRTPLERQLTRIYEEALRVGAIGVTDDLFSLGGHSLAAVHIATLVRAAAGIDVSVRDVLANPTVAGLAEVMAALGSAPADRAQLPALHASQAGDIAPLSAQQEQMWFLSRLAPESIAYHAQTTIRVVGTLDHGIMERVVRELHARHEILRTTFHERDGQPVQVIHAAAPVGIARADLSGLDNEERASRLETLERDELLRPFDLGVLPLIRWGVVTLAPGEYEVILVEHHLLHDGWSFAMLMREFTQLYNAFGAAEPSSLPPPQFQYRDYAVWQRQALASGALQPQLDYWRDTLTGLPDVLSLPTDRPRPSAPSYRGNMLRLELPAELPSLLRAFCREAHASLFTVMCAGFLELLHRYTDQSDICIGSGFANRQVTGTETVLGMVVNTILLRCSLADDPSFADFVGRVRQVVSGAIMNQEFPFPELVRRLNPRRDPATSPFTQILFSVNDSPLPDLEWGQATGTVFERGNGSAKMDLDVVVIPRGESQMNDGLHDDRIALLWEYDTDLFDERSMLDMASAYIRLLRAAIRRPDTPLSGIAIRSANEGQHRSRTTQPAPVELTRLQPVRAVTHAVLSQCQVRGAAVAVHADDGTLTYADLADRAMCLAQRLAARGAAAEQRIAICLPRGARLVTAELGVLLTGAAFVPLDPGDPPLRLAAIADDADVSMAVVSGATAHLLPAGVEPIRVTEPACPHDRHERPVGEPHPAALAYVIYTSGSAGLPKGVMISREALARFAHWRCRQYGVGPAERAAVFAAPSFDASIGDIWPGIISGATLEVPPDEVRADPVALQGWLLARGVTVADVPSALAEHLLSLSWRPGTALRLLTTGGDRLLAYPDPAIPFAVVNEYGPTEATVVATFGTAAPDGPHERPPSIGYPVPHASAHVLDGHMRPVPVGVVGGLYIGGAGVARGYVGDPAATAARFLPDPLSENSGSRLYRTGDLARQLADGRLDFCGRADPQMSIRGYRVEPAEICAALRSHPDVTDAHVSVLSGPTVGDARLVAHVVTREDAGMRPASLRDYLTERLPSYMIPASFVMVASLPLTSRGKVDARALPPPASSAESDSGPAPASAMERLVAAIWQAVLDLPNVSLDDNFFDLGGHSMLLIQVHHSLSRELHRDLPIVTLFRYPTVRALARHLSGEFDDEDQAELRADRLRDGRARQLARRSLRGTAGHEGDSAP